MTARNPLVIIAGAIKELPAGDSVNAPTPAGATGKLQYNNAAALAAAANLEVDNGDLKLLSNAAPVAPAAASVKVFGKTISGRLMPAFLGPDGGDAEVQPFIGRRKVGTWSPPGSSTTLPGVNGFTPPTLVGTTTARMAATDNVLTRQRRLGLVSLVIAGSFAAAYVPFAQFTTGAGGFPALGGFHCVIRFGISDAAMVVGARAFIGMSSSVVMPVNVEPSTLTNSIGMAQLSTDATQWYLVSGGSSANAAVAMGPALGSPSSISTAFELSLYAPSSVTGIIYWQATNLGTGVTVSGTVSGAAAVCPPAATLLTHQIWHTNNLDLLAVGLDIASIHIESDQ